jgi:hypothetical protein
MLDFTYCEHGAALSLTSQPLNTLSSVAFLFAAWCVYRAVPCPHPRWRMLLPMVALTAFIALGSMLWHSHEKSWALAADILPIFFFLFYFQYCFLRRFTRWGRGRILIDILGLALAMLLASLAWNEVFLQKSNAFVPVVFWLVYAGLMTAQRFPRQARWMLLAAPVFALAILTRIVDMPWCGALATGTHFLWHILSAVTLCMVLLSFRPPPLACRRAA